MNPDQLGSQLDQISSRLRTLETHSLGIPASAYLSGAPATKTTLVLADISIAPGLYPIGMGFVTLGSASFTPPNGTGTIVVEGQLDCRSESWDNYQSPPRRDVWTEITSLVSNTHTETPFGLTRITTPNYRSADTAITAAAWTAAFQAQFTGQNQLHVYGGWLRATWTG